MILERVGKRPHRLHLHWFRVDATAGINRYEVCRCGTRQVRRLDRYGYSPVDRNWLLTGRWTPAPTRGPGRARGDHPRQENPMTAFMFVSPAEADVAAKVGFVVRDTGQEQPGAAVQRTWLRETNGKLVPSHSSPDSPANLSLFRLAVGVEGAR